MYNIAIRADGGPKVGMGHIMRCLAVAEELKDLGCRVYFISKYKQGINKVESKGFQGFELETEPGETNTIGYNYGTSEELEDDLIGTRAIIDQQGCDLLLVDKYNLTTDYFNKIRKCVGRTAFIDDLNLFRCSADIIINGNINALSLDYKQDFKGQKLLLGTQYTLLRREFRNIADREIGRLDCGRVSRTPEIMITTGGSDLYNCTEKIIRILLKYRKTSNTKMNVIVGSGFIYKNKLEDLARVYSNIELYINHNCISEIMLRSDLAISSGGSTLYELCCCGIPTLAFIMADNQKGIVNTLNNGGYIRSLGWYTELEDINLEKTVSELIESFDTRSNYSKKMKQLIDGKGATRIAQEILSFLKSKK